MVFLAQELGVRLPQPSYVKNAVDKEPWLPEEVPPDEEFEEGSVVQVIVNRYERDRAARERCIQTLRDQLLRLRVIFRETNMARNSTA